MSGKQAKKLRREFKKEAGRSKSLSYNVEERNVKKFITLSDVRRIKHKLILEEKRKPKDQRRPWGAVFAEVPEVGAPYIKKVSRVVSDEVRQAYQAVKKMRKGHIYA
jgi:hypothetical protein